MKQKTQIKHEIGAAASATPGFAIAFAVVSRVAAAEAAPVSVFILLSFFVFHF